MNNDSETLYKRTKGGGFVLWEATIKESMGTYRGISGAIYSTKQFVVTKSWGKVNTILKGVDVKFSTLADAQKHIRGIRDKKIKEGLYKTLDELGISVSFKFTDTQIIYKCDGNNNSYTLTGALDKMLPPLDDRNPVKEEEVYKPKKVEIKVHLMRMI